MATIKVSDLRPAGYDLFSDSESYMHELSDSDLDNIAGGFIWWTTITITIILIPNRAGSKPKKPNGEVLA